MPGYRKEWPEMDAQLKKIAHPWTISEGMRARWAKAKESGKNAL
jgi:hypothetical protein